MAFFPVPSTQNNSFVSSGGHSSENESDNASEHSSDPTSEGSSPRNTTRIPKKNRRLLLAVVSIILLGFMLASPSPFAIEMPGPTANVMGDVSTDSDTKMIDISGIKTYKDKGEMRLVTVSATGVPGYSVPTAMAIYAWFNPQMAVLPQEAVYSVDTTADQYEEEGNNEMSQAQNSAIKVGLSFAHDKLNIDTSKAKVDISVDDIGGPSAGMMYTLGIVSKLTPVDEAGGKIIAGTGTIESDGSVGRIGGIQLKMIGAQRDGAQYFIAPQGNCDEVVGHVPQGLQVFAVDNIDEAYETLVSIGKGETSALRGCSVESNATKTGKE
ncbi:Lon protease [Alloscardovia theropitheci]|uniref:endopeptidase La n=2 Tax=Alloscardovia theropitheci TaxID=2496842 RepID=A0A4R0QQW7_9BIFI|nr:Lon protease [Alloscardovia theropitheci]